MSSLTNARDIARYQHFIGSFPLLETTSQCQ